MAIARNRFGRGYSRVSVRCVRPGLGPATDATRNTTGDVGWRIIAPAVHECQR
jgi:hypothetical protein